MNKEDYLKALGIDVWRLRSAVASNVSIEEVEENYIATSALNDWSTLESTALNCTACDLHKSRTHVVFGVGNRNADLLIIGEAPGAQEDQQGEPFVGRAGLLLNNMLRALKLERQDIYIANILKCRPPNNRDPKPEEVALCTPFLKAQIALIKPKVILALGRIAAHFLLETDQAMGKLRGQTFQYSDAKIPLIVTYHPAYLLRSPTEKRKSWEDLCALQNFLKTKII